jgi:RNA polymerase sigma-70 factor (ECF subfamily)
MADDAPDMNDTTFPKLLEALRDGDTPRAAEHLGRYRDWLRLIARGPVERRLQSKFDASDVVQQAWLKACQALPQFRGSSEAELLAWLREVLAHALAHEVRRYRGTQARDAGRELSLEQELADSSQRLANVLAAPDESPSQRAAAREQGLVLADVLARLPDDYREVIVLRDLEGLSHEEVARRMNRGVGAVRMLWVRALAKLRQEMGRPA